MLRLLFLFFCLSLLLTLFSTSLFAQDAKKNKVYEYEQVDVPASFQGGIDNFYQYLKSNVKYPAKSRRLEKEGKVFITFVVNKKGKLEDIRVVKGFDDECDAEALRVVKVSPKWIPAKHNKKKVKYRMTVPIVFKLSKAN
jgi:TonB family protein